jgi:leucyl/phenylalanyl-tRNA--protein transferase
LQAKLLELHRLGWAISIEVWEKGELVGGLYGILYGKIFFGESMFSKVSNASKAGFIQFVEELKEKGILLIDCQVYTPHLENLGARQIPRKEFLELIKHAKAIN